MADTGGDIKHGPLLGVIYLDSRRIAGFSAIDRQILDALGVQAASILDNARLVERERERQRLELDRTRKGPAAGQSRRCPAGWTSRKLILRKRSSQSIDTRPVLSPGVGAALMARCSAWVRA